jgi:antitoxin CptB
MRPEEEALERRRKRLLYQSRHRGTKESDLLLGAFAGEYLPGFTPEQLDRYEAILAENDNTIFDWIYRRAAPPKDAETDVLRLLLDYKVRP